MLLLGDFDGGAFHMADQSLVLRQPGIVVNFDGTQPHYSDLFCGRRVSVVAVLHQEAHTLDAAQRKQLEQLGFVLHHHGSDAVHNSNAHGSTPLAASTVCFASGEATVFLAKACLGVF